MKFVDFFERTYVINLPERVDRRIEMERELENVGMSFNSDKVDLFAAIKPDCAAPFDRIGFKGCFLSHLSILKLAREQKLSNVLILEDDLALSGYFKLYEDVLVEQLRHADWDIVHFGYYGFEPDANLNQQNFATLQVLPTEIIGTHFYAVNGQAFNRVIDFFELLLQRPFGHPDGGPMSPDGVYNVFQLQNPDITRLVSLPCFGLQRSSRSDITPKWFDQLPLLKQMASFARTFSRTYRQGHNSVVSLPN